MERTKKFDIVIWLTKLSIDLKSKLIINKKILICAVLYLNLIDGCV